MRPLNSQQDGRNLAVDTLALLREEGPEKCRVNAPPRLGSQADPLIVALLTLKERGTCDACVGFASVLTDALGTRGLEPVPELYVDLERARKVQPHRLKRIARRMQRGGLWLAAVALQREAIEAGQREPGGVPPGTAGPPQSCSPAAPYQSTHDHQDRLAADPIGA